MSNSDKLTKWGTTVPDGFTRQEYESLIESIPSTTVENAATNSDKLTKWGTTVPAGYTRQQYESLIERIPARTIVNAETISPGSEDAALLTDSSTMQDNSDSLGANNDISKEDRTELLVTAQQPEPYIPLVTKWGTSVPRDFTAEKYEQMIENAGVRAQLFTDTIKREQQVHQEYIYKILGFVDEKIYEFSKILIRKRRQLTFVDDYGMNDSGWRREKKVFVRRVLAPEVNETFNDFSWSEIYDDIITAIDTVLDDIENSNPLDRDSIFNNDTVLSGIDFELICKEKLEDLGWVVSLTKATSDQGADLIAEKNNRRVAVQCKYYSSAVGNSAVQEIVAAKSFYEAHNATVVSNNTFTNSARQLAQSNDVLLLHYDDLHALERMILS